MEENENARKKPHQFDDIQEEPTPGCYIKSRYVLTFMMFFGMFNVYSMRTNLSVAIVAMVNSTTNTSKMVNKSVDGTCPIQGVAEILEKTTNGVFNWDSVQQGLILGCYFFGYIFTCVPGGYLAKRYGVRPILGITMLFSSLITLLCPIVAYRSFPVFVSLRILLGFLQGVSFPAVQSACGKWAPPYERSTMISTSFAGSSFGTFITLPISGIIADNLGWEAVFYATGAFAFIWSVIWIAIIHNSPDDHPRISTEERRFIVDSIGLQKQKNPEVKLRTPWVAILTSLPVWGIAAGHFASNWGNYTLMSMLPTYMANILHFNLSASGGLSSLPYILQFLFMMGGGYITDLLRSRKVMRTLTIRKLNTALGLGIPAVFLALAGYIGCDEAAAVTFFSISVAFSALTVPGCKSNPVDIAPIYGGIVYGFSNTLSNIPGFLAPQVVGIMLKSDNSLSQWQNVFWLSAGVYMLGMIFYLVVGSDVEQHWASGKSIHTGTLRLHKIRKESLEEDVNIS